MKKQTGILIIVLSGLSILGVVITQIFWIDNAFKLKREQFADKVHVSLKAVVNNLYTISNNHVHALEDGQPACNPLLPPFNESINYITVDSILRDELRFVRISKDYFYGIYIDHGTRKEMVGSLNMEMKEEIYNSPYRVSLSCLNSSKEAYFLAVYFPSQGHIILKQMITGFLISGVFALIIGFSFIYIIYVSFRQKRITLIKNDFVNNMTHEFKTPISTVSLTAEMLLRDEILKDHAKAKRYARVIYEENQRLKHQVEQVLQIAVIDKGEFKIRKKDVDVHKVIVDLVSKMEIVVMNRGGAIKTYFAANYPKIWADRMHFTNILSNLLDNATKYTPDTPIIIIRTKNTKNGIHISVEDNGIGIKSEDQKDIFRQFHRVHTGNLHDVKGFGLGLYYVKLMTEAHGGSVKLSSDWGKGSIFEVFFPFNYEVN